MAHKKKVLVLCLLAGITAVGAYLWERSEVGRSPQMPKVEAEGTLSRDEGIKTPSIASSAMSDGVRRHRTDWKTSNDVEMVTRVFEETGDCLLYHSARKELDAVLNDERLGDLSTETAATLERLDATSRRHVSIVRQTEQRCRGSNQEALAQAYTLAPFKAALLGNADAESCFVIGPLSPLETTNAEALASLEDRYLIYAPIFTKNALARFDPYVAEHALNRYVASPRVHPSRLDRASRADPYSTWQVARLASLRALPEQRKRLEEKLALFDAQQFLRADDIRRADAWARATYERAFAGQPPVNLDSQTPCYSSPDLAP